MVKRYSPSGEERTAVEYLVDELQALGFQAHIDEAGNAVGEIGNADADSRLILLLGHIDTVRFKDITASGDPLTVQLTGADSAHSIEDVVFENVTLNGTPLTRDSVRANDFARDFVVRP